MQEEERIFFEKYSTILHSRSHLAPNGHCRLWDQAPRGGRKYCEINVRFPGAKKYRKINVARLALMLKLSVVSLDPALDSSHLCSNATCINPEHIVLEKHGTNNNRIACFQLGHCTKLHEPHCMINLNIRVCIIYMRM